MAHQRQQQHKTPMVALFLLAALVAAPAVAAYRPEAGGYSPATPTEAATPAEPAASTPAEPAAGYTDSTPAEPATSTPSEAATPAEPATSTPAEAATPAEPAASTPAEAATPAKPAASTPAEAATPAKPAAGYTDSTPAEPAASTPSEAATPAEPASSTPAEAATPTEPAASTPAEAATPTEPAADSTTTPAAEGKATTVEQKFIEKVNTAYKKALDAANAAAPDDKYSVFDTAFNKEIKQCLSSMTNAAKFIAMIDRAFKIAYNSAVAAPTPQNKFSILVLTLTEALRFIAATVEAHAVKPALEEAVAGGMKAAAGAQQVIKKLDLAMKSAAAAAKEAPKADKVLVFQAAFNKAIKDQVGPGYDEKKTVPELNTAYKEAIAATTASKPEVKDADIEDAFAKSVTTMAEAAKAGAEAATEPAAEAANKPAAAEAGYKPADKSATEPAAKAATEPAAEAATEPASEAATKPAAAEAGYKPAAEAATQPAAAEAGYKPAAEAATQPAAESTSEPAAEASPEPPAEATTNPADADADAAAKPAAAGGYNL